ncbi:MAG TPA: acyltransferase [Terriglobales bacterium]|nr:acyltransferase [Terriglobales bacterium]
MENLWEPRYALVDASRGLAALGVVLYHIGAFDWRVDIGHVCVMVFFVISGYCIAASADSCQRHRIGPAGYMWRRIRRIYPPYFFAICFFTATRLVKLQAGMGNQLSPSVKLWIQNLTMTQWFSLLNHPLSYAYNNQTLFVAGFWSLNYEEQFYLVVGLVLFSAIYFRKSLLVGIAGLMLPAFIWNLIYPSLSFGFFLEYWVAFAMGALVFFRLCKVEDVRMRMAIDAVLLFFLFFSLYQGGASHTRSPRSVYFEWLVTSAFALILIYGRRFDRRFKQSWLGWALGGLALISYSMYLTHQCEMHAAFLVAKRLTGWGIPGFLNLPLQVAFIGALSALFWYFCERPFLNKPLNTADAISAAHQNWIGISRPADLKSPPLPARAD